MLKKWRKAHQSAKMQIRKRQNLLCQPRKLGNGNAALRDLFSDVDFNQHAELCGIPGLLARAAQALRQRQVIGGIHGMKKLCGFRGFIALQVPNQMPRRIVQVAQRFTLPFPLLHAVFAEVPHACFIRGAYRAGRLCLRYPNQGDVLRGAASARRCRRDSLLNSPQILSNRVRAHGSRQNRNTRAVAAPSLCG